MVMDETDVNIRRHQFETLDFLSSESEQREFASKVFYPAYQYEFGAWWFDMFYPDESFSLEIYSLSELEILKRFSTIFDECFDVLGSDEMTIEQLQSTAAWKTIVSAATIACADLKHAN